MSSWLIIYKVNKVRDSQKNNQYIWLDGTGELSDVVISSRVRLARNLSNYKFVRCLGYEKLKEIASKVLGVIKDNDFFNDYHRIDLSSVGEIEREVLREDHLISYEFSKNYENRLVIISNDNCVSIMINEEDHIRLQCLSSGLQLDDAWNRANELDTVLDNELDYAFSPELGFLTACPTNTGTGMRASVMLHLPGLVLSGDINNVLNSLSPHSLAIRGYYGEGTDFIGDLYQISNGITLGRKEEDFIETIDRVTKQLVQYERDAREKIFAKNRNSVEDKIYRAYGVLLNNRSIDSVEAVKLINFIRLGVYYNLFKGVGYPEVNTLFVRTQPAHLQKIEGKLLSPQERDVARSKYIREWLNSLN